MRENHPNLPNGDRRQQIFFLVQWGKLASPTFYGALCLNGDDFPALPVQVISVREHRECREPLYK